MRKIVFAHICPFKDVLKVEMRSCAPWVKRSLFTSSILCSKHLWGAQHKFAGIKLRVVGGVEWAELRVFRVEWKMRMLDVCVFNELVALSNVIYEIIVTWAVCSLNTPQIFEGFVKLTITNEVFGQWFQINRVKFLSFSGNRIIVELEIDLTPA